jgi:two-component system alkaline phosphatase synthesis response regulator PhoP
MIKKATKILVVDDEQDILELIRHTLNKEGYEVHVAANGQQAVEKAKKLKPNLILMDVMMPVMDGMEACRQLKEDPETSDLAIIFLTARSEEFAELAGFEAGADDYVAKPVDPAVLAQRIKSLLRRSKGEVKNVSENVILGRYLLRPSTSTIYLGDEEIVVPKREFDMAMLFFTNPNRLLSRQYLAATLWGKVVDYQSRTIDTHVARLRKNLKLDPTSGISLNALYGFGYTLQADVHALNAAHDHIALSA